MTRPSEYVTTPNETIEITSNNVVTGRLRINRPIRLVNECRFAGVDDVVVWSPSQSTTKQKTKNKKGTIKIGRKQKKNIIFFC